MEGMTLRPLCHETTGATCCPGRGCGGRNSACGRLWQTIRMYLEHFGLTSQPFTIAPNPRFVYLSPQHREALAHLLYGVQVGGGFVVMTGEVGTGKTTLCRCLMEQLPEDVDIALIFNPRLSARELLASICDELRIAQPGPLASIRVLIDRLNHHLLEAHARGRRTVVLIDEAQNLKRDVLEQVRLLTNLETNESKLLQIMLVGQPELRDVLKEERMRQLAQRITARFHLEPLSFDNTRHYVQHRLSVSGARAPIFSSAAIARVHCYSKGIPRLINLICDRALLGAYSQGRIDVSPAIVNKAAREILVQPKPCRVVRTGFSIAAGVAAVVAAAIGTGGWEMVAEAPQSWLRPWSDPAPAVAGSDVPVVIRRPPAASPNGAAVQDPPASAVVPQVATEAVAADTAPPSVTPEPPNFPTTAPTPNALGIGNPLQSQTVDESPPLPPGEGRVRAEAHNGSTSAPQPQGAQALTPTGIAPLAALSPQGEEPNSTPLAPTPPEPATPPAAAEPAPPSDPPLPVRLGAAAAVAPAQALLALWGVASRAGDDACGVARGHGLRCFHFEGDWPALQRLDHPALLELQSAEGGFRPALLIRAEPNRQPLLELNGERFAVAEAELLPLWRGKALILWKPPAGYGGSMELGKHGNEVGWLRRQLGVTATKAGQENHYDAALQSRVTAFQQKHGLRPDGIAGPLTLITLQASATDGPRLGSSADSPQN